MRSGKTSSSGKASEAIASCGILIMMAAIVFTSASAQTIESRKRAERLESESMRLLNQLVSEAGALEHQEVRLKLLVEALEIYWDHDNTKARSLLDDLTNQVAALSMERAEDNDQASIRNFRERYRIKEIRQRILLFLTGRDARLALRFLQATRQAGAPDEDAALEMQMAARIAWQDPEAACRIAEGKLDEDLNPQVVEIFRSLVRHSPVHAVRLGGEMIGKLRSAAVTESYQSLNFIFTMAEALNSRLAPPKGAGAAAPLSERDLGGCTQLLRQTLEIIVSNLLKINPEDLNDDSKTDILRSFIIRINSLSAAVDTYLPDRSTAVRARLGQIQSSNGNLNQHLLVADLVKRLEGRSAGELLEMAKSVPPQARDMLYQKAVEMAIEEGDQETAIKIARDELGVIHTEYNGIKRRAAMQAFRKNKFEQAMRMLPPGMPDGEKAGILAVWASVAMEAGNPVVAADLIEKAKALIGQRAESRKDLETQLAIALTAIATEPDHGFEIADIAIDRLNRLIAAVMDFVKFESMAGDDFPLEITSRTEQLNQNMVALLSRLAAIDFQRTENILGRWQAREMRIQMGFNVIRKILIGDPSEPGGDSGGM